MNEAIVGLLFDLHAYNVLDLYVINSISKNFGVDAEELCEANGITYNME
jgi:hypothetical protein